MPDQGQLRQSLRVAIVDYRMSNLHSVSQAMRLLGAEPVIAEHPDQLESATHIVLPGVGSFSDGMAQLHDAGWVDPIRRQVAGGKPLLGICLGMQLLATRGTEGGDIPGLDLVPGDIVRLDTLGCDLRIPHVGWNSVGDATESGVFDGIPGGTDFYFVHSFAFKPADVSNVVAYTDYGRPIVAAVRRGAVVGTQFHPEKSSKAGFRLLRNFLELSPC